MGFEVPFPPKPFQDSAIPLFTEMAGGVELLPALSPTPRELSWQPALKLLLEKSRLQLSWAPEQTAMGTCTVQGEETLPLLGSLQPTEVAPGWQCPYSA